MEIGSHRLILTGAAWIGRYSHTRLPCHRAHQNQPPMGASKPATLQGSIHQSVERRLLPLSMILRAASTREQRRWLAGGPGDGNECPWSPHEAAKSAAWMPQDP